jgi:DDE_Tnp_1-associated/Transposase DDE domain
LSVQSVMPVVMSAIVDMVADPCPGEEAAGVRSSDLRAVWEQIEDPRDRRGRRHPLLVILSLVQAAVVSGAVGFAAIRHWIGAAPQEVLADIGARRSRRTGLFEVPHPDTVCRVLSRVDMAQVDAAYARVRSAQLATLYDDADELIGVSVDGKIQRGTAHGDQRAQHRMGALLAEDAITLAQLDVDGKSNEINAFAPLLDQIPDMTNMVVSADRMHTQRKHARYLHGRGAYFVLPVGDNQPRLFDRLDALDWAQVPVGWCTYDERHGRREMLRSSLVIRCPRTNRGQMIKKRGTDHGLLEEAAGQGREAAVHRLLRRPDRAAAFRRDVLEQGRRR